MTDSTELDVVIARPLITPEQASDAAKELRQMIASVLVKDKHYQKIRGRDVLLKAGAEELQKVFGLSFTYSELATFTGDDGTFSSSVKCSVENSQGRILSESYGLYSSDERRGANANTVVKMSQKRAYVGAIMSATGTSELFTQDLEDEEQPPSRPPAPSTPDERLLLAELFAKKGGMPLADAEGWVNSKQRKAERAWVASTVLSLMLRPDHSGPPIVFSPPLEKNPPEQVSAQEEDSYQQGLPDDVEPELPPDPPTIEVEVEDDDEPVPF